MLLVLSPAKTLDFSKIETKLNFSIPGFLNDSEKLIGLLRKLKPKDLSNLMGISAKLADLNFERYLKWEVKHQVENSKPAVFTFNGDVYNGLDVRSISIDNLEFLNKNGRILSGLYGVLKPFDLIQEYRLEMGIKLPNPKGKDLYHFWGKKISQNINSAIEESDGEKVLINLASNEYYQGIEQKSLKYTVIHPIFKDYKENGYTLISFFAKKARGMMARFICQEKISNSDHIKLFKSGGYSFNPKLSDNHQWVFTR